MERDVAVNEGETLRDIRWGELIQDPGPPSLGEDFFQETSLVGPISGNPPATEELSCNGTMSGYGGC